MVVRHDWTEEHEEVDEQEKALTAFLKQYKENCRACGRYVHMKCDSKCPEMRKKPHSDKKGVSRDKKDPNEAKVKYFLCGKISHYERICPDREKAFVTRENSSSSKSLSKASDYYSYGNLDKPGLICLECGHENLSFQTQTKVKPKWSVH